MDKYIGKRLDGRYEIREIIGVGGMAYVYKAYDTIDDRVVAVKILKEEFLANEEFTRRFKNESKAIAILSHPNIVRVYDVSFGEKMQYIVMEYIDGITLKEYIDQQKDIPWKEAVHFTVQILRALQHAHDKGIIHRDIKPQNIILLADGTIKVTDFGIAQFSRNDIRTDSEHAIGSVHYISPEQASGGITDEKADIYSLGIMLYEMLTGKLPFEADNAVSVAIMQMQSTPVKPRELNPAIPEGLEEITLKAMQKDPSKRYQSAAEMLYDIDEFKRNPSIHFEYTYFVDETPTRFVEVISHVRGEKPSAAEPEEDEEEEEERRRVPILPILAAIAGALVLVGLIFVGVVLVMGILDPGESPDSNRIIVPELIDQVFVDKDAFLEAYPQLRHLNVNVTREYNQTVEENHIITTDPKANKRLDPGDTLTVVVSQGAHMVEVPEVTAAEDGDTYVTRAQNAGFSVVRTNMISDTVEKGCVIRTSPSYPEKAPYGSTITVFISSGKDAPQFQPAPNLDQLTKEAADEVLKTFGFVLGDVSYANHPAYEKDRVIAQDPAPDTPLEEGARVNVTLASGYRDITLLVPLPEVDFTVSLETFVDGKLMTAPQYSSDLKGILPGVVVGRTLPVLFVEQRDSYRVTFRIKGEQASEYVLYASYTLNGLTGEWVQDVLYPYSGPTTTAAPTTTTTTPPTAPPTTPPTTPPTEPTEPTAETPPTEPTEPAVITDPTEPESPED